MQVQINTDRNIQGDEALGGRVVAVVPDALDRFSTRFTGVEVHLRDENSDKKGGGGELRCTMEACVGGLQPIAVSHEAPTVEEAATGAAG